MALFALVACTPKVGTQTVRRAVIYGDSLLLEAYDPVASCFSRAAGWEVTIRASGGTAVCDMLPQLEVDLPTIRPTVVAIETVGNSWLTCMVDPATGRPYEGDAYYEKFAADLEAFFAAAHAAHVPVVFFRPPPVGAAPDPRTRIQNLIDIAGAQARKYPGTTLSDAARNAVSNAGMYAQELPCLATETAEMGCKDGMIRVRSPDEVHFCPTGLAFPCPEWSSGASRFGAAICLDLLSRAFPPTPGD
jgi:hypothetical protein